MSPKRGSKVDWFGEVVVEEKVEEVWEDVVGIAVGFPI